MWIIPNNLQLSSGAPDTAGFISDLNEQSQICASSLMVRSKPSRSQTWSQKWKRDSWTALLSGRILRPSHAKPFETEWTCLWPVIPANPSARQESGSEQKTLATSGRTSPDQYELFAPECVFSRTSKDISASDSEKSLENWNKWVTKCRGEYSLRVKSAHLTRENESLSWPTVTANEDSYRIGGESQQSKCLSAMARRGEMDNGHPAPANPSTLGSRQGLWATPQSRDFKSAEGNEARWENPERSRNLNDQMKQWATPNNFCFQPPENTEQWTKRAEYQQTEKGVNLHKPIQSQVLHENEKVMGAMPPSSAKLNPRWVETLMGLPVGWTMPSCTRPVTIELTNCASSATESCQPPQSEHSEF